MTEFNEKARPPGAGSLLRSMPRPRSPGAGRRPDRGGQARLDSLAPGDVISLGLSGRDKRLFWLRERRSQGGQLGWLASHKGRSFFIADTARPVTFHGSRKPRSPGAGRRGSPSAGGSGPDGAPAGGGGGGGVDGADGGDGGREDDIDAAGDWFSLTMSDLDRRGYP